MGQAANVTAKLSETSGALTTGASALQELLRDYKTQRDAVGQLVSELRAIVEIARKEASLTGDVLARIEGSATRLGTAQKQADEYLAGVSRVLGEAHTTFATEVKRTLGEANSEFHTKLSAAVGLLSSGVHELELTLAAMGNLKPVRV
jgi:ABC-type transporter Mla subunit MlaD